MGDHPKIDLLVCWSRSAHIKPQEPLGEGEIQPTVCKLESRFNIQ